jgi:malonyl CoA-acyl carrier protein transacylase
LADAECLQINDTQGVYHFAKPLHLEGRLAVLFPGEGAQYLNMLADLLPHFPEVGEHFGHCDAAARKAGRTESVSDVVFVPSDLNPDEQSAAERNLWRLGNAVSSVLSAEWALYLVLQGLGVRPDVVGGHSSGEFSALAAAGCLNADELLMERLALLGMELQQEEDSGGVTQAMLLAVGTGRAAAIRAIEQVGAAVLVAMDNCPHQTVLAGPSDAMAAVESHLRASGVVCERLPFHRPYHTPLFEPSLGPIARTYGGLLVNSPKLPVYSCVTAKPFPSDPDAIRSLAVIHWASRVEFTRMIEAMHADGVRLFVEAGPRGNLTAFVSDTLRGKSGAAIASNLPRRSGLTQLNHLAGQLAAHHVPLELAYLYRRRDPQFVEWERALSLPVPEDGPETPAPENGLASPSENLVGNGSNFEVLERYCDAMDQFLDLQREVTERFFKRRHASASSYAIPPDVIGHSRPLMGEIVHHVSGRELVMRRTTSLDEDLYALDHTLGGRCSSAFDAELHGFSVMPMALSLEMMAEAAAELVPGRTLIGANRVQLHRWIPFDDEPVVLEVTARLLPPSDDGWDQVAVEIHDHGNATRPGNPETVSVEGVILFGDEYPHPPELDDFPLRSEGPCKYTPTQLYDGERHLFHGPTFQAVCATDRCGEDGIEGHLLARSFAGLFRSVDEPDLLTDPLLIDASTHILGCWHLGQSDQTGRIVLPYELGTVRFYGARPAAGSQVLCRVRIEDETPRQVSHRIDLIGPDGQVWCRLHPAEYWRFYWPQDFVNYFRFKAPHLLGKRWDAVERAARSGLAQCMRLTPPADLSQPIMRSAVAHASLNRAERAEFRTMQAPEALLTEWVFGRLAAKDAIRSLWDQWHGEQLLPADIELSPNNEDGRLEAQWRGGKPMPSVSTSHCGGVVAALASFSVRVGLEIASIHPCHASFIAAVFDESERALLDCWTGERDEAIARLSCAKAALAKAIGPALVEGPGDLIARTLDPDGAVQVGLGSSLAGRFPKYQGDMLLVHTVRDGDLVAAATFCEKVES